MEQFLQGATMAKPKDGYELLQCTVSIEVGRWIRVMAAAEGCPPGRFVERHLRNSMESIGAPLKALLASVGLPEVTRVGLPEVTRVGLPEAREVGHPLVAPSSPQGRRKVETEAMTWDELVAGLETTGKTHKELRNHLGLSNISIWAKEGVPSKHVSRIREFLAQE
jgi:hypothetical protein